jgi:spore coat protein U-like protein
MLNRTEPGFGNHQRIHRKWNQMTNRHAYLAIGALLLSVVTTPAFAVTITGEDSSATDSSAVTMTIEHSCDFTISDIDFGTLGLITSANTSDGTLTITCTQGTLFNVAFESAQTLANGANLVPYSVALINSPSLTGTGSAQVLDTRATLDPSISPPAGVYTDTTLVTVTINNI